MLTDLARIAQPGGHVLDVPSRLARREEIAWFEASMALEPQVEIATTERLIDGLYIREVRLPKGMTFIGKIHDRGHVSIISMGEVTLITEEGTERIVAPRMMLSPPGTKRVVTTHENTIWTTIHATDDTTLQPDMMAKFTVRHFDELAKEHDPCRLLP